MKLFAGMASLLRQLSLFDPPEPAGSGPSPADRPPPSPATATGGQVPSIEAKPTRPIPPPPAVPAAPTRPGLPPPAPALRSPGAERGTSPGAPSNPFRMIPETGGPLPAPPVTETLPQGPFAALLRGPYARIEVVPKPRLHESWRVTWVRGPRRGAGMRETLRLEIPSLLAEAPEAVKLALLEWALLVSRRGRKDRTERLRRARLEQVIREALRADGPSPAARRRSARDARRLARLNPKGEFHDLDAAFAAINARYFGGALEARITWSARLGGLSTHTVARDAEGRPYHLLTISRGYDDPEVTPEILGGVVYHECLHIAIPPRQEGGRRVVHGPDFRARERAYAHFEAWRKWHREGLPRALRRLRRRMGRER